MRETLINEVKEHYQHLASRESKDHVTLTTSQSPEAYIEKLLENVINEINEGSFDSFSSGKEIVESVANNKSKWQDKWEQ